jgi:reverse gyrase
VNGSETSTEVGSVVIESDHHSQEESIEGFSKTNIAILVAVASVIGMLLLISQMMESSSEEE